MDKTRQSLRQERQDTTYKTREERPDRRGDDEGHFQSRKKDDAKKIGIARKETIKQYRCFRAPRTVVAVEQ